MAIFRTTEFFNDTVCGFSEHWFVNAADHETAMTKLIAVHNARVDLLAKGVVADALRVSDISIRGDAYLNQIQIKKKNTSGITATRDLSAVGWLTRYWSGTLYYRSLFLRGSPDNWTKFESDGDSESAPQAMKSRFDTYVNALMAQGFGIYGLVRDGTNPERDVTDVTLEAGTNLYQIHLDSVASINVGDQVILRQFPKDDFPGLNGRPRVKSVDAGNGIVTVFKDGSAATVANYEGQGLCRPGIFGLQTVNRAELSRPGKREAGRRFFLPLGAS